MSELRHPSVDEDATAIRLVLLIAHPSEPGATIIGTRRWPVLIDLAAVTTFLQELAAGFRRLVNLRNGGPAATGRTSAACSGHLKTRLYLSLSAGGEEAKHGHQEATGAGTGDMPLIERLAVHLALADRAAEKCLEAVHYPAVFLAYATLLRSFSHPAHIPFALKDSGRPSEVHVGWAYGCFQAGFHCPIIKALARL